LLSILVRKDKGDRRVEAWHEVIHRVVAALLVEEVSFFWLLITVFSGDSQSSHALVLVLINNKNYIMYRIYFFIPPIYLSWLCIMNRCDWIINRYTGTGLVHTIWSRYLVLLDTPKILCKHCMYVLQVCWSRGCNLKRVQ
jgi:hypothetical protein